MAALFDSAGAITNEATLLFNKQAAAMGALVGERVTPAVAFFTGNKNPRDKTQRTLGNLPHGVTMDGGRKVDIAFMRQRSNWSGTGYGSGNESAASTFTAETTPRSKTGFYLANYTQDYWEYKSDWDSYKGKTMIQQVDWRTQENIRIMEACFRTVEAALCGAKTVAPTATQIGSILAWLIGDTLGEYDRTLAENADLKGTVDTTAALTLALLRRAKTSVGNKRGENILVLAAQVAYDLIGDKVETASGYMATTMKNETLAYSGNYYQYHGMDIVQMPELPTGTVIVLDPSIFAWHSPNNELCTQFMDWSIDPAKKAMYLAKFQCNGQLLCTDPAKSYVFTSVTS